MGRSGRQQGWGHCFEKKERLAEPAALKEGQKGQSQEEGELKESRRDMEGEAGSGRTMRNF